MDKGRIAIRTVEFKGKRRMQWTIQYVLHSDRKAHRLALTETERETERDEASRLFNVWYDDLKKRMTPGWALR